MNERYLASREPIVEPTSEESAAMEAFFASTIESTTNLKDFFNSVRILSEEPPRELSAVERQLRKSRRGFFHSEFMKLVRVSGTLTGNPWAETDPKSLEELLGVFPQVADGLVVSEEYGLRAKLEQLLHELQFEKAGRQVDIEL